MTELRTGMRPARLGFLGLGWIGLHRMEAIARSGVATVAAICDTSEEAMARALALAPEARRFESLAGVLDAELDGLVIATPSGLHARQAIAALDRGLAVFCQKPLARSAAETRQVIDAAHRARRLLAVDLSYRFTNAAIAVRQAVQRGEIGEIFAVDLVFHNAYGPSKGWCHDPELSGGGCVIDLGIHLIDLALWTLGFPTVSSATGRLYAGGVPLSADSPAIEDYAEAQLSLATGTVMRMACSWRTSLGCDAVIVATFHGSKGGLAIRNVNGSFHDFVAERFRDTACETLCAPPDDWGGRAAVDWARRLANGEGTRFDPAVERLEAVARALDGIYGRAGRREPRRARMPLRVAPPEVGAMR
jgi:predicted dehydrogenase